MWWHGGPSGASSVLLEGRPTFLEEAWRPLVFEWACLEAPTVNCALFESRGPAGGVNRGYGWETRHRRPMSDGLWLAYGWPMAGLPMADGL